MAKKFAARNLRLCTKDCLCLYCHIFLWILNY